MQTDIRPAVGEYRGLQRRRPYIRAPPRSSWPAAKKAEDDGQIGAAVGGINADAKRYLTMESSNENE
jgi:hypothetical protein